MKQTFIEEFEHDNTPVQNNLSNLLNKMDFLKLSNLYHFDSKINRDTFFLIRSFPSCSYQSSVKKQDIMVTECRHVIFTIITLR